MCGIVGIYAPGEKISNLAYLGLFALQHRGQESAGIAVSDGETITVVKDMGLVATVFDERKLAPLDGHIAIGHVRYSTTGSSHWQNAQPLYRSVGDSGFAIAHNGNLTNTSALEEILGKLPGLELRESAGIDSTSDSDLVAELIAHYLPSNSEEVKSDERHLEEAILKVLPQLEGAFSMVFSDEAHIIGVRDPLGFHPLVLGKLDSGWALASETSALDIMGAHFVRDIEPGEIVVIDANGVRSSRYANANPKMCVFEFVYFARPDSQLYNQSVHAVRQRMGEELAKQAPANADMVMPVPESGVPAAQGFARQSGIAYGDGVVKNRYVGRTFISPSQKQRGLGVKMKLNPIRENIEGKKLIVVDDSIVRGTTTKALISMLREAGAAEIHFRVSSPPYRWPCFFGIDTGTRSELIAANMSVGEICEYIGADSLAYLEADAMIRATDSAPDSFCTACLTGQYAVKLDDDVASDLSLPDQEFLPDLKEHKENISSN
ncbi:MAG: amidophosphoribosyltransferase [Acidimicrobiia bacterium]